ncbi:MAG TPA: hypothetical protein VMZ04_07475 [Anaerolineae bacterium]|nr:hypothetical protein [Anaerolineae bacterium]
MAKKKRTNIKAPENEKDTIHQKQDQKSLADFFSGQQAKWVFFAIYFFLTVFLFREFLFSNDMLFGSDTIPDGIYTREYYKEYHARYGGIPHWNPYILGGLPFIDAMHGDTFYPGAWLKFFMPLTRALGLKLVYHVFLAGVFMYLFLRTLSLQRCAAFLGGLMYMLAPSFVSLVYPGHDAKMYVIAFLPLAFALLESGMYHPRLVTFIGLGSVMGLLILTSHVQMAYYSYWAIGLYFFFRVFTVGERSTSGMMKRASLFILAVVIALALGAVQLLPSYKFTTSQSVRAGEERTGYDYATSWSLHPEEIVGMVVPSFQGNDFIDGRRGGLYTDLYWGKNPFKLNTEYHGILVLLFAVMALLVCRNRSKWFFLTIALLSLIYALGANTPLYRLFYAFVPGVKNFRAPSMIIFLFCFAFVVLASQFISSLLGREISLKGKEKRFIYIVVALVLGAFIISIMGQKFFDLWNSIFFRNIPDQNLEKLRANIPFFIHDLWKTVILLSMTVAGIWAFLSKKMGSMMLVALIALVTFIDESFVDSRFITVFDPASNQSTAPDSVVKRLQNIMKENAPFRILGFLNGSHLSSNYYAMFGIQVADGHHNNELQTYELFRGGRTNRNFLLYWLDGSFKDEGIRLNNFLKVAGVKYIVIPTQDGGTTLLENEGALERVFSVHSYVTAVNDTLAIEMLKDSSFDPSKTAIINGECSMKLTQVSDSTDVSQSTSLSYTKNGAYIKTDSQVPELLVLTDNWSPYWYADVDRKPVRIHRAYGTFMAVECPAGKHEIRFLYDSRPYETGKTITLSSLAFIVLSFVTTGALEGIKKRKRAS